MDPTVELLFKYGWQGVVVAVVIILAKAFGPAVSKMVPILASASAKREDQLLEALRAATAVMTEIVSELRSLRSEVGLVRVDQFELRSDLEYIAERMNIPRPRPAREKKKPEKDVEVTVG